MLEDAAKIACDLLLYSLQHWYYFVLAGCAMASTFAFGDD